VGFKTYPRTIVDHNIVVLYHMARLPQPDPVPSFDPDTVRRVEELYSNAAAYFQQ
jgi:hypothetical protein